MEIYPNIVITFYSSKEAALYFDNVIPFGSNFERLVDSLIKHGGKKDCKRPQDILLPKTLRESKPFSLDFYRINQMHSTYALKHNLSGVDKVTLKKGLKKDAAFLHVEIQKVIQKYNLDKLPIISSKQEIEASANENCESPSIIVSLPALNLINVENVSWEHIEEFKNDPNGKTKLRRLKLFAYENYQNKPIAYIEDDILLKIEEYENTVKKWGFETRQEILSMVLSSKVLAGAIGGYFISTLLGSDIQAIFTVIGGASIELGRIGIMLKKRKYEIANIINNNPISYISSAKTNIKDI